MSYRVRALNNAFRGLRCPSRLVDNPLPTSTQVYQVDLPARRSEGLLGSASMFSCNCYAASLRSSLEGSSGNCWASKLGKRTARTESRTPSAPDVRSKSVPITGLICGEFRAKLLRNNQSRTEYYIVRNDEVVGSIPTSSTIFSSTCGGMVSPVTRFVSWFVW